MDATDGTDPYGRRVLVMSMAFVAIFMAFNTAQVPSGRCAVHLRFARLGVVRPLRASQSIRAAHWAWRQALSTIFAAAPGLGNVSFATLYTFFCLGCIPIPSVVDKIGPKIAMIIGSLPYAQTCPGLQCRAALPPPLIRLASASVAPVGGRHRHASLVCLEGMRGCSLLILPQRCAATPKGTSCRISL